MAILNDLLVNGISRFIGGVIMPATNVTSSTTYYPVLATGTSTSLFVDTNKSGLSFTKVDGTTGAEGTATLTLGNTTASGTAGNATGQLRLLDYYGYAATIRPGESHSAAVQFYLPNWTGSVERLVSMPTPSTQVGGTSTPVYVDAKGHVTVCTSVMSHTHNLGITAGTSSDTSQITLSHGTKYVLSAGGSTYCFTMPSGGSGTGTVTGSGIASYLAKWSGTSGESTNLTVGPLIGSGIKQFLREDGNWAKPFASQIYMGWCDTARATAAKTVTLDSSFELVADTMIMIRFANGNSAASPTLNINSTGAKSISFNSASMNNTAFPAAMPPNTYLILLYTGSSWTALTGYSNSILMSPFEQANRLTTLDRSYAKPVVEYLLATSSTTTGKPPVDASVLNMNWDNGQIWGKQLAVGNGSARIFTRAQNGTSTWGNWLEVPRLSGALTNGQIIVSDETTGTALLKGVSILPTTSIQATATELGEIATGDYFLFSDQSDNGKVKASLGFDTTKTTEFLRRDGTWQVPSGGGNSDGPFYVAGTNSIACVTTSPYYASRWKGTNNQITSLYTGLTINFKIDVAGNGSYGTVLNINDLGEHPVCANVSTYISTRYGVNCIITLIYDANQTATAYINSSSASTITGVWKIADYDSTNTYYFQQNYTSLLSYSGGGNIYRYQVLLSRPDLTVIPVNNVNNAPGTYNKTLTSQSFDPFGPIYYFVYNSDGLSAGSNLGTSRAYRAYLGDIRYSFNINSGGTAGTTALTAYRPVYIKALYNDSTKQATLAPITTSSNYLERSSLTQSLPSVNPNSSLSAGQRYIYIYLGYAYDKYRVDFAMQHQVYAWNSITGSMCPFNGEPFSGSGTFTVSDGVGSSDTWSYTKVGKQVTVSGTYTGSSTSVLSISELPFSVKYAKRIMYPFMLTSPMISWIYGIIHLTAGAKTIGTSGTSSNATGSWLQHVNGAAITFDYVTDD